jgi:hypothetical protein
VPVVHRRLAGSLLEQHRDPQAWVEECLALPYNFCMGELKPSTSNMDALQQALKKYRVILEPINDNL